MTRLILIRHGQSQANFEIRYTGHSHFPLTELGKNQAKCTAEYVAQNYKIDKIYSSDLLRAYETAIALSERLGMKEICSEKELREIDAGLWEGLLFEEIPEKYPEDFAAWKNKIEDCRCTGGESIREMHKRIKKRLLEIAKENDGQTVAITFHSTPIRALAAYITNGMLDDMHKTDWPSNASVTVVDVENDKMKLELYSYDQHLLHLV